MFIYLKGVMISLKMSGGLETRATGRTDIRKVD